MENNLTVNVMHEELYLKTITVQYCRPDIMGTKDGIYCFVNSRYDFPDTDRLYLEDIDGYRYKRTFPEPLINGFFYFTKI